MAKHSIIDPVDRIEGHLRVEMEVTDGKVSNAWVSGGLFRGLELIVKGREPFDAAQVTQRICGVCPVSQVHASSFAGEEAYGIERPNGARVVRNMVEGAQFMHSHILWFYQLSALDYVNPLNALNADVEKTYEICEQLGLAKADFGLVKARLEKFAENGQYSWLSGGWFLDGQAPEAYLLPPEVDLIATAHYIEAIDMQATADEISSIIGGKMPHIMTSMPGGTAFVPSAEKVDDMLFRATKLHDWVVNVMIPDAIAIAKVYLGAEGDDNIAKIGVNENGNFMAYGVFDKPHSEPFANKIAEYQNRYLPGGIVHIKGNEVTFEEFDRDKITETTTHSYYQDDGSLHHPTEGVTEPPAEFPGFYKDEANEVVNDKYSWIKAPRYNDEVMEVGPLSRVLVAYASGVKEIQDSVHAVLKGVGLPANISSVPALNSALGRLAARPIEAEYVAKLMIDWCTEMLTILAETPEGENPWFAEKLSNDGQGQGCWEAPRGAIYHTETIHNNKIESYQIIIPSTWNISPRDEQDRLGALEQSLIGTPVANIEAPINALRIVHGYDPCIACAVHITEPKTGKTFTTHTSPWGGR